MIVFTLCLICQQQQVLLGFKKCGFLSGQFNGIGGKVKDGESLDQAAKREVYEEVGLTVDDLKLVGVIRFCFIDQLLLVHVFRTTIFDGQPQESEEIKPQWFATDQIPYDQMPDDVRLWMSYALEQASFTGEFQLDANYQIISHKIATRGGD